MLPYIARIDSTLLKAAPIFLLMLLVYLNRTFIIGYKRVFIALLFSSIGDVILNTSIDLSFELGLASFLIAHLWYIAALSPIKQVRAKYSMLALFGSGLLVSFIIPDVPKGFIMPVSIYMTVILAMLFSAINSERSNFSLIFGAIMFVISDSLIAINKFIFPIDFAHALIMVTYYTAQWFLIKGFIIRADTQKRT